VETLAVGVWFDIGTRNESAQHNGIAHLLEHMVFKGTQRRNALQIAEEIESVGGHTNAYTARDYTAYYARVLARDGELAVDLLSDIILNSTFDPIELEREKQVIIQEIHQTQDTPDDIIFDHLQSAIYGDQPLGRAILGQPDIIQSIPSEAIRDYRNAKYGSNNTVLAAAGKVDHDRIVEYANRYFAGMKPVAADTVPPSTYTPTMQIEARDLDQCHVTLALPACGIKHPDYYAYSVYSTLLGGSSSSRLFQEVREKRGLAYSIYSFLSTTDDEGTIAIYAGTGADKVDELAGVVRDQLLSTMDRIDDAELRRAKQQIKSGILMGLEQTFGRAELMAQNLLTFGRIVPTEEVMEKIDAVDAAHIQKMLGDCLRQKPALAGIGPAPSIDNWKNFSLC
jgi:predicted Zn-dependent peptidase